MLMCLCYGISYNDIKKIVQTGVTTTENVQKHCQAGTGCGCCLEALTQLVEIETNKLNDLTMSTSHEAVELNNSRNQFL
jgi:bacterioferritin-associated ferredoxin